MLGQFCYKNILNIKYYSHSFNPFSFEVNIYERIRIFEENFHLRNHYVSIDYLIIDTFDSLLTI